MLFQRSTSKESQPHFKSHLGDLEVPFVCNQNRRTKPTKSVSHQFKGHLLSVFDMQKSQKYIEKDKVLRWQDQKEQHSNSFNELYKDYFKHQSCLIKQKRTPSYTKYQQVKNNLNHDAENFKCNLDLSIKNINTKNITNISSHTKNDPKNTTSQIKKYLFQFQHNYSNQSQLYTPQKQSGKKLEKSASLSSFVEQKQTQQDYRLQRKGNYFDIKKEYQELSKALDKAVENVQNSKNIQQVFGDSSTKKYSPLDFKRSANKSFLARKDISQFDLKEPSYEQQKYDLEQAMDLKHTVYENEQQQNPVQNKEQQNYLQSEIQQNIFELKMKHVKGLQKRSEEIPVNSLKHLQQRFTFQGEIPQENS